MKKAPVVIVGLVVLLAALLGIAMYSVDSADDVDSVLSAFNNMDNLIKKPISVEEVIRQVERMDDEDDSGYTPTQPVSPGTGSAGAGGGGSGKDDDTGSSEPPQDGTFNGSKTINGTLQYICQGNWWNGKYMHVWDMKLGSSGRSVQDKGCYFCTLTMASAFFRGKEITESEFKTQVSDPSNFSGADVYRDKLLSKYGAGVTQSGDKSMSLDAVKKTIDSNKPLTIHFKGPTSEGYYTSTGHYALIIGYSDSDNALILYDPGKGESSKDKKLTYSEYESGIKTNRIYTRTFD